MNYAHFHAWIEERVEDLVSMGVPRDAAAEAFRYLEIAAINAETQARKDDQLILDFGRIGSTQLAKRHGVSPRTVRDWRSRILRKKIGGNRVA